MKQNDEINDSEEYKYSFDGLPTFIKVLFFILLFFIISIVKE